MPASAYRFGPFLVDRAGYHVLRGGEVVGLTPKLLDLLLYLLDRPATLVTKDELLEAVWPDANVTENALAQAMSELRQALGDEAGSPTFIKTIARRGYRFIAPVETVAHVEPTTVRAEKSDAVEEPTIAVMDFANVTGDADSAWLAAGIAETVTGDLRGLGSRKSRRRRRARASIATRGARSDLD